MDNASPAGQWVGVDMPARRSVICRIDAGGQELACTQIDNDRIDVPVPIASELRGPATKVGTFQTVTLTLTWPRPSTFAIADGTRSLPPS